MTAQDLSALIGSRICHDLISPLGAIGNGVELLSMSNIGNIPEIGLIEDSVTNANARIKFYRIAFGVSSSDAELAASEVKSVVSGMYKRARMSVDWSDQESRPRDQVKLAFLLLQCAENAMPWGGRASVTHDGTRWIMRCSAERIKQDQTLWGWLDGSTEVDRIAAADVQFALAPIAANAAGRDVGIEWSDVSLTLSF